MKAKIILAALMTFLMSSCEKELGEYVYEDHSWVIHTDKDCLKKNYLESGNERIEIMGVKGVNFIPTQRLPYERSNIPRFCPHCVNDRQAKQLRELYNKK